MLGLLVNWLAGGAARLHHLLLRRRLHDVAEALDAAEHRHRRRRRRLPADDRLGRGDRRRSASKPVLLFLIIFMWTPPHFWALALYRADDYARAGMPMLPVVAGAARDAPPDPALFAGAGAGRRRALAARLSPAWSTASSRSSPARLMLVALARAALPTASRADARRPSSCSPISILYLFVLFAVLLIERASARSSGVCMDERHER